MLKLFAVAASFCFLFSCSNNAVSEKDASVYSMQKQSLVKEETKQPLSFLKVYASNRKNLWGSTVVKGAISNAATVCSYKNVRLKLLSYDKQGKMLEEHEDVINGPIKPNASEDFRLRYHLPRSSDSVSVSIISALVSE